MTGIYMHACLHYDIYIYIYIHINAVTQCDIGHITIHYCWLLFSLYWYIILQFTEPWINKAFVFTLTYEPSHYALLEMVWMFNYNSARDGELPINANADQTTVCETWVYILLSHFRPKCMADCRTFGKATHRVLATSYCDIILFEHWFG